MNFVRATIARFMQRVGPPALVAAFLLLLLFVLDAFHLIPGG